MRNLEAFQRVKLMSSNIRLVIIMLNSTELSSTSAQLLLDDISINFLVLKFNWKLGKNSYIVIQLQSTFS